MSSHQPNGLGGVRSSGQFQFSWRDVNGLIGLHAFRTDLNCMNMAVRIVAKTFSVSSSGRPMG